MSIGLSNKFLTVHTEIPYSGITVENGLSIFIPGSTKQNTTIMAMPVAVISFGFDDMDQMLLQEWIDFVSP